MTNMVTKLGNDLLVCSPEGYAMITICTLSRARARLSKGSKIRRPVRQKIDGVDCIFVSSEWERAKRRGRDYYQRYYRDIPWLYGEEMKRCVLMSPRLAKQRVYRLKLEADAAGEAMIRPEIW
jgi:hypothetical protein